MVFETEESLTRFLEAFHAGAISAKDWTHAAHVAMATAYVWDFGDDAFPRIRAGIHHLNWHHGTISTDERGYHETLTVFWTEILRGFARRRESLGRLDAVNAAVRELPAGLFREYYGFDVVKSKQARRDWVPPDLKPLA